MRILLDKGFIRRMFEGFARLANQQTLTDEQRIVLEFFRDYYSAKQLYMSYKSFNTLTSRFGHLALVKRIITIIVPLYPTKYARRWARRLRKFGFGREDALMISMGSFCTDKIFNGRILGVERIVTLDKRMYERFQNHYAEISRMFNDMTKTLERPFNLAKLPKIEITNAT